MKTEEFKTECHLFKNGQSVVLQKLKTSAAEEKLVMTDPPCTHILKSIRKETENSENVLFSSLPFWTLNYLLQIIHLSQCLGIFTIF